MTTAKQNLTSSSFQLFIKVAFVRALKNRLSELCENFTQRIQTRWCKVDKGPCETNS